MAEQMKESGIQWIGAIPYNWNVERIKHIIQNNDNGIKVGPFGSALTNEVVSSDEGKYKVYGQSNLIRKDFSYGDNYVSEQNYKRLINYEVLPNDIAVSMMGTIGKCSVVPGNIEPGIMDSHLIKIRLSQKMLPRYFEYAYESDMGYSQLLINSKGSIMNGLNSTIVKGLYILVPEIIEQQAIVDFLDKECAQIDSIATDLEKQIALLQQYKKSLITETVTKGLDKSVPMKDSGVEWIGEIPEHWEISRVRHLASLCSGATPSKDVLSYWEGNIPWVSSQEVKSDIIKDTSLHISEEAINSCSTQLMPAGTLVMVVRSGILQHTIPVALLGVPATINQDIKAFQFNHLMLPAYFKYYIQGENDALLSVIIKDKTTVESVDNQLLLSLKIMVPPIEEQKAIVAFLNYKCGYIDKILNDKQEQLNLLMQHKKSLIYEYVTGKKRVKEVQ